MRFLLTPSMNDGMADADPVEVEVANLRGLMVYVMGELVNDNDDVFGPGFTLTIKRLEDVERESYMFNYGMYSEAGDRAVHKALVPLLTDINNNVHYSPEDMERLTQAIYRQVAIQGYGEVHDTAVREEIWAALARVMKPKGYNMNAYGWYGD